MTDQDPHQFNVLMTKTLIQSMGYYSFLSWKESSLISSTLYSIPLPVQIPSQPSIYFGSSTERYKNYKAKNLRQALLCMLVQNAFF